jgi:hypothetical protein
MPPLGTTLECRVSNRFYCAMVLTCHVPVSLLQLVIDFQRPKHIVASFIKQRKKDVEAVPDSKQSDHKTT